ncbi:hypothetical protein ACFVFF_38705 [Streptomyces sp. NPDC057680]|uniref:hypothetical protein n=1 Tax=Streptomyces sp. NPDC057680 TaxID=3346208 RepID=UPI0036B5B418
MYSLAPGYRLPAVQRGLSPAETLLTKLNAGAGGAVLASALISPPPIWALAGVGAAAALLNLAPGPRSVGRWAAVGYRYLRERTAPDSLTGGAGETRTWTLYPAHGTMQDAGHRAAWHDAVNRALVFAAGQARAAGIQVHVTHHAVVGDYTEHIQTISVHVPRGLIGQPDRVLDTLEREFARLGALTPVELDPLPSVVRRDTGWAELETGRYAATARVTKWPAETDGGLMGSLLLGTAGDRQKGVPHYATDRSFAVLYRPLPVHQSRRSAMWQSAAAEAWTTDKVKKDEMARATGSTHGALVDGATLVDLDAYLTVWGDSPEDITEARWQAELTASNHRIGLDWLPGQQHRAHAMTTPHGASTTKGAVL